MFLVDSETMAKRSSKPGTKLFDTDLRKERTPFLDSDLNSWTPGGGLPTVSEKLLLSSQPSGYGSAPRMTRVDSYRAPPLRLTLETIVEDKPDYFQRSKSVPVQKRLSFDAFGGPGQYQQQLHRLSLDGTGQGLCRLPSYRPGQCAYGISASGPMTFQANDHVLNPPRRRSRFSKMRDALRCNRIRDAFGQFLSKMRLHHQTSRRSA